MIITSSPTWTMPRSSWPWTVGRCGVFFLNVNDSGWWMWKDGGDGEFWVRSFLKQSIYKVWWCVFDAENVAFSHYLTLMDISFPQRHSGLSDPQAHRMFRIFSSSHGRFLVRFLFPSFEGLFDESFHGEKKDRDISGIRKKKPLLGRWL